MTLVLKVDSEFNNPDAPYITLYDPIESRTGSVFLWDGGKQETSIVVGSEIPNMLSTYQLAKKMKISMGQGSSADHALQYAIQKTTSGGLHFISAHAGTATGSTLPLFYAIESQVDLSEYLYSQVKNNPNLYISVWQKGTRTAVSESGKYSPSLAYSSGSVNNSVALFEASSSTPSVSSSSKKNTKVAYTAKESAFVGLSNCIQMNILGEVGTGIDVNTRTLKIGTGALSPFSRDQTINKCQSLIIYRVYIEDLNSSGRTYEQVKAIDDAEFNKAFGVGGRFYGDSWSDPMTVLP